jgi:hypothetical protein
MAIPMTRQKREKIHKESKFSDEFKKLPFKFSKPRFPKFDPWEYECPKCKHSFTLGRHTRMIICGACKHLFEIEEEKRVLR